MRPLTENAVKALCTPADFDHGAQYYGQGKVTGAWHTESGLQALVAGSGAQPYRVAIVDHGEELISQCTCPAHRRRPFCKHVAAVLVAWVRVPGTFAAGDLPAAPKAPSQARRAPKPRVDRHQVQAEGLAKIEGLLVELASYGLLSLTEAQVARVNDLAHAAESHKLRRLARLVADLGGILQVALSGRERFDEKAYAGLLSDAWLTAQATQRALADPLADPTTLEELVGKTWREKDLERRAGVGLIELAYETVRLDSGFTVDTSYLLSLDDGVLYTEKQIVPTSLDTQRRKPSYSGLLYGEIGLYPGPEPRRVKLIEMASKAELTDAHWRQALAHAERSLSSLVQRFQAVTARPLAPRETYAFFAPDQMLVEGPVITLIDGDGLALPVPEGWRILSLLMRRPAAALFGRLTAEAGALCLAPLALVYTPPGADLVQVRRGGWSRAS